MRVYTGYFAKTKEYEKLGLQPVSIAGKAPDFFKGPQYKSLAPEYKMFNDWKKGKIDNFGYTTIFTQKLNTLDKEAVKRFLSSFDKDVVLLCYEKPGDFCHRHIVADWMETNLGIRVDEWDYDKIMKMEKAVRTLMDYRVSVAELDDFLGFSCLGMLKDLEENPPEGYILIKEKDDDTYLYTLEDRAEFLAGYDIT